MLVTLAPKREDLTRTDPHGHSRSGRIGVGDVHPRFTYPNNLPNSSSRDRDSSITASTRSSPACNQIADPLLEDSGADHDELLVSHIVRSLAAMEQVAPDLVHAVND